ncbi:MAG: urea ABC transporter permease subunit UrtB, partial [Pseudomonadota bacterium]|nr:urea ABC transporter permease subunit UrtB [Pseudomonadota bacterium]
DSSKKVRNAAHESALLIRISGNLRGQKTADRRKAAEGLQEVRSQRGSSVMKDMLKRGKLSKDLHAAFTTAAESIDKYHYWVRKVQDIVNGISLGSILVLMALGLAIIFGQMGVINMAHGELMMVGAYAAYEMQELFGHRPPDDPNDWYFVAAFPVAFLAAGLVGYLIERLVVRHLYGRPLDTLLATWGIGLILIQTARVRYGDNIGLSSPETLVGGMEPITGLVLGYGRFFVVIMAAACVLAIHVLFKYTRSGLLIRATVQNRDTANSLGVNTRRVDGLTFALGSGLAGIAGCSLICVYGSVTPDMGQNFIVDSFLVVVTGGVGELAGAVWAGLGLGVVNKFVEPLFSQNGVIWAKVLILLTVVMFIQWRPAGLFPPKGRLADD